MTSPATIHVSTACLINNEAQQNVCKRLKMLVINLIRRMLANPCMVLYVCGSIQAHAQVPGLIVLSFS